MKILVFTSTRADSGILSPLVENLTTRRESRVEVLATGTHLEDAFGKTLLDEVGEWGAELVHEVRLGSSGSSAADWARSMAIVMEGVTKNLVETLPDVAILVGDRAETLAFAFTCNILGIPLVHMHGGEVTQGAQDELFRHAITKLSTLHFPNSTIAAKRIIQLGEDPNCVVYFAPFINSRLITRKKITKSELAEKFSFTWGAKTALVTMHGASFDVPPTHVYLDGLLTALKDFPDLNVVFTGPNIDPESAGIREKILEQVKLRPERCFFVESFGAESYLSMLRSVDVAIGNSSSLVLEAPFTGTPTVILGDRQKGRSDSPVVSTGHDPIGIASAILGAMSLERESANDSHPVDPAPLLADTILNFDFSNRKKRFYDLP